MELYPTLTTFYCCRRRHNFAVVSFKFQPSTPRERLYLFRSWKHMVLPCSDFPTQLAAFWIVRLESKTKSANADILCWAAFLYSLVTSHNTSEVSHAVSNSCNSELFQGYQPWIHRYLHCGSPMMCLQMYCFVVFE